MVNEGEEHNQRKRKVVRGENTKHSAPVESLVRGLLLPQSDQDARDQESGYCKEKVYTRPAQTKKLERTIVLTREVADEDAENCDRSKSIKFLDPLQCDSSPCTVFGTLFPPCTSAM